MKTRKDPDYVRITSTALSMRRKTGRHSQLADNTPLSGAEKRVYDIIRQRLLNQLRARGASEQEALNFLNDAVSTLGQRGIIFPYIEPVLILGAPVVGFILNVITCMALYAHFGKPEPLLIIAPLIHLLLVMYQRYFGQQKRQQRIQRILTEGV